MKALSHNLLCVEYYSEAHSSVSNQYTIICSRYPIHHTENHPHTELSPDIQCIHFVNSNKCATFISFVYAVNFQLIARKCKHHHLSHYIIDQHTAFHKDTQKQRKT